MHTLILSLSTLLVVPLGGCLLLSGKSDPLVDEDPDIQEPEDTGCQEAAGNLEGDWDMYWGTEPVRLRDDGTEVTFTIARYETRDGYDEGEGTLTWTGDAELEGILLYSHPEYNGPYTDQCIDWPYPMVARVVNGCTLEVDITSYGGQGCDATICCWTEDLEYATFYTQTWTRGD